MLLGLRTSVLPRQSRVKASKKMHTHANAKSYQQYSKNNKLCRAKDRRPSVAQVFLLLSLIKVTFIY